MQDAIQALWNDPERCERMGKAARAFIVKHHNMEQFVAAVKNEVDRAVGLKNTRFQTSSSTIKSATQSVRKEKIQLDSEID